MRYLLIFFLLISSAYAQTRFYGNGAIIVFPDRIQFDWSAVHVCAMTGDVICRIAQEARR